MNKKIKTKIQINVGECYASVLFNPKASAAKMRKTDPAFRATCDALEDEFAALGKHIESSRSIRAGC